MPVVMKALDNQEKAAAQLIDDEQVEQPRRVMRTPEMPSIEEIQSHRETHIPFRSWCSVCGQAKSRQRWRRDQERCPSSRPIIVFRAGAL